MANCVVSGTLQDLSGTAATSITVFARVVNPQIIGSTLVTPLELSTSVDASGNFSMTIQQSLSVIFTIQYPVVGTEPMRIFNYTGNIPATATASFVNVIVVE